MQRYRSQLRLWLVLITSAGLAECAYILDRSMPSGLAFGSAPYVALVLLGLWAPWRRYVFVLAVVSTTISVVVYLQSTDEPTLPTLANRLFSLATVWVVATLCFLRRRRSEVLLQANTALTRHRARPDGSTRASDQLTLLLDALPIVPYSARAGGDFAATYVSNSIEFVTGYSAGDFTSNSGFWSDHIHPDDRDGVFAAFETLFEKGQLECEYRWQVSDGSYRWFEDVSRLIEAPDGTPSHVLGVWHDVTDRKQAEESIQQLNENLEKRVSERTEELVAVNRSLQTEMQERERAEEDRRTMERKLQERQKLESLGLLAGGIAHDFNNLLTGVLGNASLARSSLPMGSELGIYLDDIEKTSRHASDLCRQMLAYSGAGRFMVETLQLNELIEDMTQLLRLSISKTAVLKYDLTDNLPAIEADAAQMRQIILNLVVNSSEAIGDRSGIINISTGMMRADRAYLTETHLSPDLPEGDYIFLELSDDGCGMDEETRAKIFDPFFTTKFTGRGLGLAAVLGIVRGHKGAMKVYSEPRKGTTFKLLLPCSEQELEERVGVSSDAASWRGSGTVLIVDDEETVQTVAARILESLGFEVVIAPDGRQALKIYRDRFAEIAAVVLDLTMPHMDGEATFRELRQINPNVKTLLISGFNEQEAITRFTGKGLAGFMQKPFGPDDLAENLRAVLEG